MKIDRTVVNTLLALDDARLEFIINRAAFAAGIDTKKLGFYGIGAAELRKKLLSLTDEDLAEINRSATGGSNGGV